MRRSIAQAAYGLDKGVERGGLASVDAPTQFRSRQLHASGDGRLRMVTPASPGYSFLW